ncbi:MAG TPA: cytochrome c biogenesis protein CcsA [Vicinamibacterales bacterium]|jgi:heme exporter protein C|nr:cytochrome c biogenesis protein CcsA [Vicinamibacterales bacterium]
MNKFFLPLVVVTAAMFVYAPFMINAAPYQSTMLLIQKIFYFHVASWVALTWGLTVCAIGSLVYLFQGKAEADRYAVAGAELTALFGAFGLISGMLWARKAWGIWWEWDARLTMALMLELIFLGYMLVRKFGGPGAEKLAAGMGIFGAATAPFIYKSVDWWRTIHPKTSVIRSLDTPDSSPAMAHVLYFCMIAFTLLFAVLLMLRVRLEEQRAILDQLYLEEED